MPAPEEDDALTLVQRRQRDTTLEVSVVAADLFLRQGSARTTVAALAAAAGISTRTFHRYFPAKADALAPVLSVGMHDYLRAVAAIPEVPHALDDLEAALVEPLAATVHGPDGRRHADLVRLVTTAPDLLPVWLRMHEECVHGLVPLLAARLPGPQDPLRVRFVSTLVVTANRLAVEEWAARGGDVRTHLGQCWTALRQITSTDAGRGAGPAGAPPAA